MPFGGFPRVIRRGATGPGTNTPDALIDDSSTESVALVPGRSPCNAVVSAQEVGVGVPLTAVMIWATLRTCEAGVPVPTPLTSTPASRLLTL